MVCMVGASSADDTFVLEVFLNYGSAYCQRIDSPMMVELAILRIQSGKWQPPEYCRRGENAIVHRGVQRALPEVHRSGLLRR